MNDKNLLVLNHNEYLGNNPWFIVTEGINTLQEREIESLLSLGNGYIGTRNSLVENYDFSSPATFVAGLYEEIFGTQYNKLVNVPDWTRIRIFVDGNQLDLINDEILEHRRYLDLRRGLVVREWKNQDGAGRITNIKIVKYISLDKKNEAFKSIMIKPENYSGRIRAISGIDGAYEDVTFPVPSTAELSNAIMLAIKTEQGNKLAVVSQKSVFLMNNEILTPPNFIEIPYNPYEDQEMRHTHSYDELNKVFYEQWDWHAQYGQQYSINSIVTIFSSLEDKDPVKKSREYMSQTNEAMYREKLLSHVKYWDKLWNKVAITITNDLKAQKILNFAIYQLIKEGKYTGNDTSIPARGLTGNSYLGHIFWDADIYMFPFYLFCMPDVAKALLMYRYNTLNGARLNAKAEGFEGASYAWESTDSGVEMTPVEVITPYGQTVKIYSGKYENHITPDVAYSVWQYWLVTGDEEFLVNYGSEIIFETARFSKSLLIRENDGYYHLYNVVGPDEYHNHVNDNAFTNFMVQHNLDIAVKLAEFLESNYKEKFNELKNKIGLKDQEINEWREIKDRIYVSYDSKTKLYEQFDGFFELEYIGLEKYEPRTIPMDIILGPERIRNTQVIKQPDVLMFIFLLSNKFSNDVVEANFDYYEPRCSHGSSLSPSIHGIIAARLGKTDKAYNYFIKNGEVDLNNNMGNASGGIHMASVGGSWMVVVMGFAGMQVYDQGLMFDPHLPINWTELEFAVQWKGQRINVQINENEISFEVIGNKAVNLSVGLNNWKELEPDRVYQATKNHKWYWD